MATVSDRDRWHSLKFLDINMLTKLFGKTTSLEAENQKLRSALEAYANPANWGETASYGHKRKNRWQGEGGAGYELAIKALSKS